jgi:hypothetical protein
MKRKAFLKVIAGSIAFPVATYGFVGKLLAKMHSNSPSASRQPEWRLCVSINQDTCTNCELCVDTVGGCCIECTDDYAEFRSCEHGNPRGSTNQCCWATDPEPYYEIRDACPVEDCIKTQFVDCSGSCD